ncbi:DUF4142 domain-containing protein [Paraburkholderia sprentiae WSM5005]|uniref:DUF4142 domain-containing protein n=1 Tax=Paraburkholderia sprentiae WSM5005 TaxID=754502 RepID=A0A1I9YN54_9BURK|nr:DUF4142 domain-containing protein [Paraburkholderia sprentiae]APA87737.1 DUF4142 domain-containing protein [Paraburkholderia sprentiae WSM5005]
MIPSRKAAALVLLAALSLRMYDVHAQHTDQQIAAILMVANRAEIEAGNLALSRSQRRSIQNFAGQMIAEHRDLYQSAVELTQRLMLYPENSRMSEAFRNEGDDNLARLNAADEYAFDGDYLYQQVTYNQQLVHAVDNTLLPSAKNAELKALLVRARVIFILNLDHAIRLQSARVW